ncbi:MAG: tetratricopeptide repeat protein [Gammaproteobacteria bacterium]|nr:tetratricopeptide repeat protein [Gammaproteobacteria bacterium]MDH5303655.1 tetratricopeptide repeat protein [Gammaproteobacteria bacterium]MDH5322339.1 tetratricopeptide repeat protein [Gammaproteobacteria bacterium]
MRVLTREQLDKGFRIGAWEVYPARGELRRGEQIEKPEPKVMAVLLSLAMRDGDVVTKDELVDEVWDGRATADDPIIRCIFQLRGHFNDREKPFQYVGTLVRRGYCLQQPVVLLDANEPAAAPVVIEVRKSSRLWAVAAILAVLVATGIVLWNGMPEPLVASIGVLPFDNLTGDPANDYLASGFKTELVHTLQNIPELSVKNAHVRYVGVEIDDIARQLRVDSVLIGALRMDGNELRFNYQIVRASDGVNVASDQVSGPLQELFRLQEELAGKVRRQVVGGAGKQLLSSSRPENFDAYERFIRGMFALERRGVPGNLEDAIALFEESIRLDPNYGPSYLALAEIHVLLPDYRGADVVQSNARAIEIVNEGIARDPAIADAANAVFGFVYHKQKKWAEAERAFIRATSASVVESNAFNWYSLMLGSVGRFDAALEQALAGLEIDPSSAVINSRVAIVSTWTGRNDIAADYFERSRLLGAGGATHLLAQGLALARQGKLDEARPFIDAGVVARGGSTDWIDPAFAALADPAKRPQALQVVDELSAQARIYPQIDVTLRMMLGDTDGALRVARMLVQPGELFEMEMLFLPEFRPLQERPEFLELMQLLGVSDYWQQAGCKWQDLAVVCR